MEEIVDDADAINACAAVDPVAEAEAGAAAADARVVDRRRKRDVSWYEVCLS